MIVLLPVLILLSLFSYSEPAWGSYQTVIRVFVPSALKTVGDEKIWLRGGDRAAGNPIGIQHPSSTPHIPNRDNCYNRWKICDYKLDWGDPAVDRYQADCNGKEALGTPMMLVHENQNGQYWTAEFNMQCDKNDPFNGEYFQFKVISREHDKSHAAFKNVSENSSIFIHKLHKCFQNFQNLKVCIGFIINTEQHYILKKVNIKAYHSRITWESPSQDQETCIGQEDFAKPFDPDNHNHIGRCGRVNYFTFNDNKCTCDHIGWYGNNNYWYNYYPWY